mgnify:CR=1 FL=1
MIETIRRMLAGRPAQSSKGIPVEQGDHGLHVAACALLLELAHADDEFTEPEREHITASLVRHFDLAGDEVRALMAVANEARRESVDLHQFTSVVAKHYDEGQRMVLAELMWRVAYADGRLSQHEDYLTQKFSRLLDLRPGYLAEARARATGKGQSGLTPGGSG